MAIYNFDSDLRQPTSPELLGHAVRKVPAIEQLDDIKSFKVESLAKFGAQYSAYVREDVPVAFYGLERSLKHYFSDIPVPAKDHVRFMRVRISGGKRATLLFTQGQQEGKTIMPIAALSGGKDYEFNPEKYSLPYYPMAIRYLNNRRDKVAKVFRPVPVNVNYTLTVMTESKRDMGIIQTHILRRFNPYAEIMVDDGRISGAVQLFYSGATNTTEFEVPFDDDEVNTWELSFKAEAWIPLPELITPTVRGVVTVWRESCESTIALKIPGFLDYGV